MKRRVSILLTIMFVFVGGVSWLLGEQVGKQPRGPREQFRIELEKLKPELNELSPEDRDRRVEELQNRIVAIPGWWQPRFKEPANAVRVFEQQTRYAERLREMKAQLDKLPREEQIKRMEDIKKEIFEEDEDRDEGGRK
jgi:hypothetical protein